MKVFVAIAVMLLAFSALAVAPAHADGGKKKGGGFCPTGTHIDLCGGYLGGICCVPD